MIFEIKATPKAKRNLVQQLSENQFKIFTTAVPEKGLANKKIISLLADFLDISKSKFKIISGQNSNIKKIEVN